MHKSSHSMMTVTGCLSKGSEEGGYMITGADGKVWELSSKSVKLADHVGHQVTVSGAKTHMSKAGESKMEDKEKAEAGGKPYGDMKVTKLTMVSATCGTT